MTVSGHNVIKIKINAGKTFKRIQPLENKKQTFQTLTHQEMKVTK